MLGTIYWTHKIKLDNISSYKAGLRIKLVDYFKQQQMRVILIRICFVLPPRVVSSCFSFNWISFHEDALIMIWIFKIILWMVYPAKTLWNKNESTPITSIDNNPKVTNMHDNWTTPKIRTSIFLMKLKL